jgi:hypothetical protein
MYARELHQAPEASGDFFYGCAVAAVGYPVAENDPGASFLSAGNHNILRGAAGAAPAFCVSVPGRRRTGLGRQVEIRAGSAETVAARPSLRIRIEWTFRGFRVTMIAVRECTEVVASVRRPGRSGLLPRGSTAGGTSDRRNFGDAPAFGRQRVQAAGWSPAPSTLAEGYTERRPASRIASLQRLGRRRQPAPPSIPRKTGQRGE